MERGWKRRREDLKLMEVSGADALSWLQGQVTQDVRTLTENEWSLAFLCRPTGQLESVLELRRASQGLQLLTGQPDALRQRFEKYVILEDVRLRVLEAEVWTTPIPGAEIPTTWVPGWGHSLIEPADAQALSDEDWNRLTLEAGVPLFGIDTDLKTLPPELGDFAERGISWDKGCYLGQEVLMRIHSRGHVNRSWQSLRQSELVPGEQSLRQAGEWASVMRRLSSGG